MLRQKSVEEVALWLIDKLEATAGLGRDESLQLAIGELRQVVPEQQIAPVQFEIRQNKLAILNRPSLVDDEDRSSTASAKEELEAAGEKILKELERSNCDRRLLESVRYLQDQLTANSNVVRLGLSNLTCEAMCNAYEKELPDAVGAMLRAHTRGIELYVGQFPEWHRFIENAALAHFDTAAVNTIAKTAAQLTEELEKQPELAHPEVPETIKRINELLRDPSKAGRRTSFAMLRTLENLISKAFSHGADLLEMSVNKSKEHVAGVVGRAAAVILLTIALESAISITPVAGKLTEGQWRRHAIELVQKHIKDLQN